MAGALALACAQPAAAQTCHPLTGTWAFDAAASRMGGGMSFNPYYAVAGIGLTLDAKPGRVMQSWHLTGAHLDEIDSYTTPTDGSEAATDAHSHLNTMPARVQGTWEACTLVEAGTAMLFGQTVVTTSRFVVSADDRRLTIQQEAHSDLGDSYRTLVFTRAATTGSTPR